MADINVTGTPFYLGDEGTATAFRAAVQQLSERVELLRGAGKLREDTILEYYGQKRFEQIAESNAIEGSTLSVGETELAVLKGVTITGHDPAYSRDARALAAALERLIELAKVKRPIGFEDLKRLHELILGERPGAGSFRAEPVRISGSDHRPPATYREVLDQMEQWEAWSLKHLTTPALLRASVLHAWLVHIHPFIDGNGRTARAITNLELIRAGYPPIILRKKDKAQYLDALAKADQGQLGAFFELVAGRTEDALRDLEHAATTKQGYDQFREKQIKNQTDRLAVWNAGVNLLLQKVTSALREILDGMGGDLRVRQYDSLAVEGFMDLCAGKPVRNSWAFEIRCRLAGMPDATFLAWSGVPGYELVAHLKGKPGRPALLWSTPNPGGYPAWQRVDARAPGGAQITWHGDACLVVRDHVVAERSVSDLADQIARDIANCMIPGPTL